MAFNINRFKSELTGGGARPSLFEVTLNFPLTLGLAAGTQGSGVGTTDGLGGESRKLTFMCKASSIPASTIAPIEVPYFGRKVKFAGNRTFAEWTITIINDEDFLIRKGFEAWLAGINGHETNTKLFTDGASGSLGLNAAGYQQTGTVKQFGKKGNVLRSYQFINVFPSEVSPIELNWSSENEIEEYTITLQYDYWVADPVVNVGDLIDI
jgi:hypothetical protein